MNIVFKAMVLVGLVSQAFAARSPIVPHKPGDVFEGLYIYSNMAMEKDANDPSGFKTISLTSVYDLGVEPYGVFKDTKMLQVEFGDLADDQKWNQTTFENNSEYLFSTGLSDSRRIMLNRCWAVAVYNLYSYFYGNRSPLRSSGVAYKPKALTLDEIVFHGRSILKDGSDSINGIFSLPLDGGGDIAPSLQWVFPKSNVEKIFYRDNPIDDTYIISQLSQNKPVPMSLSVGGPMQHSILVDGLAKDLAGQYLVHIINTDNLGNCGYAYLNTLSIESYVTYDIPIEFRETDALNAVDQDSDNDGLVDFDEVYRFHTDKNSKDSDNDGIDDFTEVYSYTHRNILNRNNEKMESFRTKAPTFIYGNESKPEKIRSELNQDSDGDGLLDGEEDLNHNGIYEPDLGETDPYNPYDGKHHYTNQGYDVPGDFAFYAIRNITMDKGSECVVSLSGCSIASEYSEGKPSIRLVGDNKTLENVYTKGLMYIGEGSRAKRLHFFALPDYGILPEMEAEEDIATYNFHKGSWNYFWNNYFVAINFASEEVVVDSGNTYTIKAGTKLKSLTVKRGATLVIKPGIMYIGSIKMEQGSTFTVSDPGEKTVIHMNNKFIWAGNYTKTSSSNATPARGIKIMNQGSETMYVEGDWYGTIFAPKASVYLGRFKQTLNGRVLANSINLMEGASFTKINYNPNVSTEDSAVMDTTVADTTVSDSTVSADTSITDTSVVDTTAGDNDDSKTDDEDAIFASKVKQAMHFNISGNNLVIFGTKSGQQIAVFDIMGSLLFQQRTSLGETSLTLPSKGRFVLKIGHQTNTITIK